MGNVSLPAIATCLTVYGLGDDVVKCCGAITTPSAWSEDPGMVPRELASLEVRMRCDSGKCGGSGKGTVDASGSDRR